MGCACGVEEHENNLGFALHWHRNELVPANSRWLCWLVLPRPFTGCEHPGYGLGPIVLTGVNFPSHSRSRGHPNGDPNTLQPCEEGFDKCFGVERFQVVDLFADADKLDRQADSLTDGDDHAAFGGAVEFGQHDAGAVDGFGKALGLADAGLAGGQR